MDVAATERAEAELNRLVERQAQRTGADEANAIEAMWRASERAHAAKQREENRIAWCDYYRHLAACNIRAARDFRRRAKELEAIEVKETV